MNEQRSEWRRLALDGLTSGGSTSRERVVFLDRAGDLVRSEVNDGDDGPTAMALVAYAAALEGLADLGRWEEDTLAAAVDAERHRRAAEHKTSLAAQQLPVDDPLLGPLRSILERIAKVRRYDEADDIRAILLKTPVPVRKIAPPKRIHRPSVAAKQDEAPPAPRAAVISSIDGSPVTAAHVVQPGRVHDLSVEARVLDWPAETPTLVLRYLSRWPPSSVDVTDISLERPAEAADGVWVASGTGHLALHAAAADPAERLRLSVEGELIGDNAERTIALLGHPQLAVRTFDPAGDVSTGAPALDDRIQAMLTELRDGGIAPDEQDAFGRFLGAVARAGVRIEAEREFPESSNPSEAKFQAEMLKRLGMATELGGRITEHAWQGGGETDLAHDGVVAELKVEKTVPATIDRAGDYLRQPTQYASADQRQLSILVILDMTPKEAPPGVLANSIEWLEPRLHGLDDPAYPSKVAVVILKGNLPRPSDWSR